MVLVLSQFLYKCYYKKLKHIKEQGRKNKGQRFSMTLGSCTIYACINPSDLNLMFLKKNDICWATIQTNSIETKLVMYITTYLPITDLLHLSICFNTLLSRALGVMGFQVSQVSVMALQFSTSHLIRNSTNSIECCCQNIHYKASNLAFKSGNTPIKASSSSLVILLSSSFTDKP